MKMKKVIRVVNAIQERAIPYDILNFLDSKYYSKTEGRYVQLGEMDIWHFIRVMKNNSEKE